MSFDAPTSDDYTPEDGDILLALARNSIHHGLEHGVPLVIEPSGFSPALGALRCTFVTLKKHGTLRGCIGALQPEVPLVIDTANHAFAAAFRDPRFPRLQRMEFEEIHIDVSILLPPVPLQVPDDASLVAALTPGVDGLTIYLGQLRATFLPAVWESLPDPSDFLRELKQKAGIPAETQVQRAERYRTQTFAESRD